MVPDSRQRLEAGLADLKALLVCLILKVRWLMVGSCWDGS